jgi:hypothetical protein
MPSGGARRRSGPAPDPGSLRQLAKADEWIKLPASGRDGEAPEWPLPRPTLREKALWAKLWRTPQAIEWERQQLELEVGLYVRSLAQGEVRAAPVNLRTLVRQMAGGLGLTRDGLHANKWMIVEDRPAETVATGTATSRPSSRDRLKVVPTDAD